MSKIVYISPEILGCLRGTSIFLNTPAVSKVLSNDDLYFALFSTLYQSGANYFQTSNKILPKHIQQSSFWQNKIIAFNNSDYQNSTRKAKEILDVGLHFNPGEARSEYLRMVSEIHLGNLFYSLQTGNSFINVHNSLQEHHRIIEKKMNKELWLALKNLYSLIEVENICTVTPKYSILKKDVKRFEEITGSILYQKYQSSILLASEDSKIERVKKDIASNSLKLFNKYGNYLSLNDTVFNFIRFGKKIIDPLQKSIPSFISDFVLASIETMVKNKRTLQFYEIKEINFENILFETIKNIITKEGPENSKQVINEIIKELESQHLQSTNSTL